MHFAICEISNLHYCMSVSCNVRRSKCSMLYMYLHLKVKTFRKRYSILKINCRLYSLYLTKDIYIVYNGSTMDIMKTIWCYTGYCVLSSLFHARSSFALAHQRDVKMNSPVRRLLYRRREWGWANMKGRLLVVNESITDISCKTKRIFVFNRKPRRAVGKYCKTLFTYTEQYKMGPLSRLCCVSLQRRPRLH